jgi:hypothetical protein
LGGLGSVCAEDGRTSRCQKSPTTSVNYRWMQRLQSMLTSVPHFLSSSSNRSCENGSSCAPWAECDCTRAGRASNAILCHNILRLRPMDVVQEKSDETATCRASLRCAELCNSASYHCLQSFRDRRCGASRNGRSILV